MCTASFRMPLEDVGRLIDTLDDGYVEAGGDQLVESGQHAVQPQEGEHYSGDYPETGHYARPRQDDYPAEYQGGEYQAAEYHGGEDDYQGGHYPEQETQVASPPMAEERPQRGGGPSDVLVARGTPGPDKLVASYNTTSDAVPRENLIVGDSLPYGRQPDPAYQDPGYQDPAYQEPGYQDTGYHGDTGYQTAPDLGYGGGPDLAYQSDTGYQTAPDAGYTAGGDTGYQTAPDTGYAGGGDTGYQPLPDPGYAEGRETGYPTAPPGGTRRGRGSGGPATDPYGFSASEVDDHAAYAEPAQPPPGQGDYVDRYGTQPDAYAAEQYSTSPDQHGRQIPHPDPYGTSGYADDDPGYGGGGGERGRRYHDDDPQGYSGVDPDDPLGIGAQARPEGDDYYQPDAQPPRPYDSLYATGERLRPEQGHDPRDERRDW
ncbi:hypothetical protein [Spongiactinospora rosea]|uniref:hypothetical protein n=1 Tax=Spongiactinospora rosea TaxID=2248750 RepID=UPI0013147FB4|nr:hypothetical protein [Spongiactinospora rosea]